MHCVVVWNVKAQGPEKQVVEDALKVNLTGLSWVRALPHTYVVKVRSQSEWVALKDRLVETCQQYSGRANFLISPVMEGGRYNGYLPKTAWPKLNERTDEP